MNKIKVLPDNLANQIAAGEVVERPASVIKELLENSLDAGATRVQIDIELGGRRLMRVADDGHGMTRDDAVLAFERHATSKIQTLEDLGKIRTLGFRGEALASIASVAKVELITKTAEDAAATRVYIEGGRLIDVKDAPRAAGTTISVRDLFFNTPARRKFMRSEATENYHLTNIVTHYALANPAIAFALTNNGREVLRVSTAKDLRERAFQIFGSALIESLLPVAGGREFVARISGYVSAPRERRTTRDAQYFFINGRFVRDKVIAGGLLEGFRSVLPHGVYPVAFLFLDIPHEEIDVNVHPAKTEVRFRRSEAVKESIAEAVRAALANAGIVREQAIEPRRNGDADIFETEIRKEIYRDFSQKASEDYQPKIEFSVETPETTRESGVESRETFRQNPESQEIEKENQAQNFETNQAQNFETPVSSVDFEQAAQSRETGTQQSAPFTASDWFAEVQNPKEADRNLQSESESSNLKSQISDEPIRNPQSAIRNYAVLPPVNSAERLPKSIELEKLSSSKIRPIGQLHESYIIAVDDEGMLLIDQHVAHERILFDKFRKKETERRIESQNLLLPETLDLTPAQAAAFGEVEAELEAVGFGLMRLSGRTIAIKAVPTDLPPAEVRNLLAEILDTVDAEKRGSAKQNIRDSIAASLACKAAVKVNMKLTPEKMQWLIDRLLITSSPTTCPHGRPVILRLTMKDIERGFHRT
ncbi:MAG: DNA mismatch repair endonuclease MutL [Acidobacteriota bacterium]|nr:DNA mismatch repair endonuclease MutL [Acidobacteriota bacterium]